MLRNRPSTSTTLFAWTVVKTRWPVSADWMAICAVSGIANLAHHDLVGVVSKDRPQSPCKGQPLFLVDGNLRDSPELILDRVFNRDDLVFD